MVLYKPTSPGRRGMTRSDFGMITKNKPEKKLLAPLAKTGARNKGKISVRHHGGGAKRRYRTVEFGQRDGDKAEVLAIEYDPNRSARIALIQYDKGEKSYIIAPQGLKVGNEIDFGEGVTQKIGDRTKLKDIPVGTFVYNIELSPGQGGKLARSAGVSCKIFATEGKHTTISMPSGEVRKVLGECYATIGSVSNPQHGFRVIGKAGRTRHMGKRPHVRGSAMNPVDHPHGGGEGRSPIGLKHPKTPWGKVAYGVKTRRKKKYSDRLILQRRKPKKKR